VRLIWRWSWTVAVLALIPLAIATHIETRTPGIKPGIERAPISPAPPREPPPLRRYTVCGIAGSCWEVQGRSIR
jgi:hypothetical protein